MGLGNRRKGSGTWRLKTAVMPTSIGFPPPLRDRIESADRVGVSALSCYEIAFAQKRGRSQHCYQKCIC